MPESFRPWDACNGDPCTCPKPARRPSIAELNERERQSLAYAFLGDRTSQPDGDTWDHDGLRRLVDDLLRVIR